MESMDYGNLFSGIDVPVRLKNGNYVVPINFDNAATTPSLKKVEEFIYENMHMYGSVGRGGQKSQYCTEAYEVSREEVLNFFGLSIEDGYEVIYVKNTTEGLNLLASGLCTTGRTKVLTTRMEHHANDLPWRFAARPYYCEVDIDNGMVKLEEIERRLVLGNSTIEYVTITGASNVTGYVNKIHEIAKLVHRYGAKIIVDAAQLVAHREIDIKGKAKDENIDFLVCSAHKMYAPFGSGVIVAKKELIANMYPMLQGGGAVSFVMDDDVYYKEQPYKDEAGTPNFLGVMALVAAMTVLKKVGFDNIYAHEKELTDRVLNGLRDIKRVKLYGAISRYDRLGVIPFNIEGINHHEVGNFLQDKRGIAVRTGCFCAQPYVRRLLKLDKEAQYEFLINPKLKEPGMVRASFGLYNTNEEVDEFLNVIESIKK